MLERLYENDFDDIYAIMKDSFPADEMRGYDAQKALFGRKEYFAFGVKENDGSLAAFITMWKFSDFTYGEHFAVSQDLRGSGMGGRIINEAAKIAEKRFCFEVEPPETDIAKRRIAFYERNGFILNDFHYIQPPLSESTESLRLMIMSYGKMLTDMEFQAIKNTVYRNVYGVSENYGI